MSVTHKKEIDRIVREYELRDSEKLSEKYHYSNPRFQYHMQEREWFILKSIRDAGVDLSSCRLLEVGSGSGHILDRFLEFGVAEAYGIDLMGSRLLQAKQRYPLLHLTRGDATVLPYCDHSFDLVIQFMCMSSILDRKVREEMANEMWRVVRPGGYIVHFDMRPAAGFIQALKKVIKLFAYKSSQADKKVTPTMPIGLSELKRYYSASSIITLKTICLTPRFSNIAKYSRTVASILSIVPIFCTHYLALIKKDQC